MQNNIYKFESINAFESMNLQKHQFLYFIKKTLLHNKMTTFNWSVIVIGSMGEATIIIIIIIKICLLMQKVKSPKLPPPSHFLSSLSMRWSDDT
jgi:hypothetical protein